MHRTLECGVEFAAELLPQRRTVAIHFQMLSGVADDPAEKLGLAHLIEQTLDKGTDRHDARGLADAFDRLGVRRDSWVGRESFGFRALSLPEYLPQVVQLHAEMLRSPTFPDQACRTAVELACQELDGLQDEPIELLRKVQARQAYGPRLGRHPLGEQETLSAIGPDDIRSQWASTFSAARLQVAVAGPVDVEATTGLLEQVFSGFGPSVPAGRDPFEATFSPATIHVPKQLEQQYISICWPGVPITDPDFPVERVILGILAGGMSGRLFTEVREKLGLVYWVGAWHEHPRGAGMVHLGASTSPDRCEQTLAVLMREVDRLTDDLHSDELERAIIGIVTRTRTRGEITMALAAELADDLFYYGRPVPIDQKLDQVSQVGIKQVGDYLERHRRDRLSIVTLGPHPTGSDTEK
ncbi:MAG TPA: pitrilysin family protein [Phycisphaerae bacterium]|nr:pitrilysin family protein [Phycisphaerae bacterium]